MGCRCLGHAMQPSNDLLYRQISLKITNYYPQIDVFVFCIVIVCNKVLTTLIGHHEDSGGGSRSLRIKYLQRHQVLCICIQIMYFMAL